MKSFLEEYGFAILAAIVVILLIAMATPVGSLIKNQVMGVVGSFSGTADNQIANVEKSEIIVNAEEIEDEKCKVTILIVPSKTNEYEGRFSINEGDWSTRATFIKQAGADSYRQSYLISESGYSKQTIKYEIYDKGTDKIVASGEITLK